MAKKKKAALKPVANRGFATTSTPSKRPEVNGTAASESQGRGQNSNAAAQQSDDDRQHAESAAASADRIFEEKAASNDEPAHAHSASNTIAFSAEEEEQQAIQNIVDRLSERVSKDAARFWKTIEYERRLAKQLPIFDMDKAVRDDVLLSLLDGKAQQAESRTPSLTEGRASFASLLDELSPNSAASTLLQKALVSYALLGKLGYTTEQALRALQNSDDPADVDACVAWLTGHLGADSLLLAERRCEGKADIGPISEKVDSETDAGPESVGDDTIPPSHSGFSFERQSISSAAVSQAPTRVSTPKPASDDALSRSAIVLLESIKTKTSDVRKTLEDDALIDSLEDPINTFAQARLAIVKCDKLVAEMERTLKSAQGESLLATEAKKKAIGAKALARQIIDECQASPAWSAPAGQSAFGHLKMSWEDEEAKLDAQESKEDEPREKAHEKGSSSGDDDRSDDGLFGDLLDEPANEVQDVKEQRTIHLRQLPVQAVKAHGSRTPRAFLADTLRRTQPSAIARFEQVATGGRLFRSRLTLRWIADGKSVVDIYTMTGIATHSEGSADDLMATAALLCVDAKSGQKVLGAGMRDWWDELADCRKTERDADSRRHFRQIVMSLGDRLVDENLRARETLQRARLTPATTSTSNGASTPDNNDNPGNAIDVVENDSRGADLWRSREKSERFQRMLPGRQGLPIAAYKEHILGILAQSQVMVLSGETGCGKSTQVPAFILQHALESAKRCKIYVTEPRRISAISLADRVSQELGEARGNVGKDDSLLGSAVRLENNIGRDARLIYATTGIVLRMLESGRLEGITHIIVDEVHERSIESDFLLIILKGLMQVRKDLKVILMSATLDAERISAYFGDCPVVNVPGRTHPVDVHWLEDAVELCDYTLEDGSPFARRPNRRSGWKEKKLNLSSTEEEAPDESSDDDGEPQSKVSGSTQYRPKTISTLERLDENTVNPELIVALLEQMCFGPDQYQQYSAATLVFLPGLAEIRRLHDALQAHRQFGTKSFQIFALHSTIAGEEQSLVFDLPPKGVRKIVISTNIAETGITIPDITCVIDSGKQREMRFDEKRQMSKLVECFVARSNAKQRRGRAGRVQHGICWHLFTKYRHDNYLAEHPIPEMLRLSLQDLALKLKVMKVQIGRSIEDALGKALDAPSPTNVQRAIASLVEIKALTKGEEITALGRQLSRLPLDVHMGKLLLMSCSLGLLDSALTVAAALNGKSPFLTPFGRELEARAAKRSFDAGSSDFVTVVRAFNAWRRATANGVAQQFCQRCFLSHTALVQMEELRQQYMTYLLDAGFVNVDDKTRRELVGGRFRYQSAKTRFMSVPTHLDGNARSLAALHAALAAALYPKMLIIDTRSGALRTLTNNAPANMHPSSVNFKLRLDQLPKGIHHFVYYTIMQSRRLFAWETAAVDDRALLLLCGEAEYKFSAQSIYLDRQRLRITFYELKTLLALKMLRQRIAKILQVSYRNPGNPLNEEDSECLDLAARFLGAGANDKDLVVS